uniref:Uncharacterized protein n=1 Tax=Eptatretus burgeri TaxID=7764 RepID=A0A8C4QBQ8_EPTBU
MWYLMPGVGFAVKVAGLGPKDLTVFCPLQLGWKFLEADDFHPLENKLKMSQGVPLNDQVDPLPLAVHVSPPPPPPFNLFSFTSSAHPNNSPLCYF